MEGDMASMDLSVTIVNDTLGDQEFIVYQQNVVPNLKNYLTAAWEYAYLANGGARWDFVLPAAFEVSGTEDAMSSGSKTTNVLAARYGDQFALSESTIPPISAFKIEKIGTSAGAAVVTVLNTIATGPCWAEVDKNGHQLFAAFLAPNQSVNFAIEPTLYVAIASSVAKGEFFEAPSLAQSWAFPYEGFTSLVITATQNPTTGELALTGVIGE